MDISKITRNSTIDFKNMKNVPSEAVLMFQWMLTKHQFPKTYLEEINFFKGVKATRRGTPGAFGKVKNKPE